MVYRIRYRRSGDSGQAEAVVEANSPTEAIVKFHHLHGGRWGTTPASQQVTSVRPEIQSPEASW